MIKRKLFFCAGLTGILSGAAFFTACEFPRDIYLQKFEELRLKEQTCEENCDFLRKIVNNLENDPYIIKTIEDHNNYRNKQMNLGFIYGVLSLSFLTYSCTFSRKENIKDKSSRYKKSN